MTGAACRRTMNNAPQRPDPEGRADGQADVPQDPVQLYLARISTGSDFPAFSDQVGTVMDVLHKEDTPMHHLANIVLKDYSLTLKVLRTANSLHYNRSGRKVLSVTQAMVVLGVENVRDLATSLMMVEHFHRKSPGVKELIALSMLTASHARAAAEHVGYARPEEANLAGMFRNVGEVAIACHVPQDYQAILARVAKFKLTPNRACRGLLHFRFEELGAAICQQWGLAGLGAPAGTRNATDLDRIVAFGHDLTNAVYRQSAAESPLNLKLILQHYGHDLSLTPDLLQSILHEGVSATQEMFDSMQVSIADLRLSKQAQAAVKTLAPEHVEPETPADTTDIEAAAHGSTAEDARERLLEDIDQVIDAPDRFDLSETMLTVLEGFLRSGPFSRAVFCLLSDQRKELIGRFGLGEGVDALVARLRIPLTIGPAGLAIGAALLRRSDLMTSLARNPTADEARLLAVTGARSVVLLPLVIENKAVGAIYADRVAGDPPDASAVNFTHHLRERAVRVLVRARRERESVTRRAAQITPEAKSAFVLRMLRGESPEAVARETGLPVHEVESWKRSFLEAALEGLKSPRPEPGAAE